MNAHSFSRAMATIFAALVVSRCFPYLSASAYSHHRPPTPKRMPLPSVTTATSNKKNNDDIVNNKNNNHNGDGRRRFFRVGITAAAATIAGLPQQQLRASATEGIISSKYCAYGEGDDCEDLAGGNPYILELQRKSAANKQANIKSAENAFYAKNYPDWFAAVGKTMVQKESDGTYVVIDNAELAKLWEQNKIAVKTPTTMGGRVTDVTQKPMLVLKE